MTLSKTLDAAEIAGWAELDSRAYDLFIVDPMISKIWSSMGVCYVEFADGSDDAELDDEDRFPELAETFNMFSDAFGMPQFNYVRETFLESHAPVIPEDETLAQWGKRMNLVVQAINVPFRPDTDAWNEDAIHFNITVRTTDKVANPVLWSGFYSVGSAHPEIWAKKTRKECDAAGIITAATFTKMELRKLQNEHPRSIYAEGIREKIVASYKKAAPIALEDILDSLRMDAMGADQSFDDWAGDCGADTDSRKALATYEACRDVLHALQRFSRKDFESLMQCEGL